VIVLRRSDIYVLAGGIAHGKPHATLRELASYLELPDHSVVQRAYQRAREAGLVGESGELNRAQLEEFLVHASRFVAPARLGPMTAGVPAAWAAKPMADRVRSSDDEPPPVWPSAIGQVRGQELEPLHPAAVEAARKHPELGRILSLVDSIRAGDLRVRTVAAQELHETLRTT